MLPILPPKLAVGAHSGAYNILPKMNLTYHTGLLAKSRNAQYFYDMCFFVSGAAGGAHDEKAVIFTTFK